MFAVKITASQKYTDKQHMYKRQILLQEVRGANMDITIS